MTGASLARASKTLGCLRDNHGSVPWAQPDQIILLIEQSLIFSHRRVLGAQGHPDRRTTHLSERHAGGTIHSGTTQAQPKSRVSHRPPAGTELDAVHSTPSLNPPQGEKMKRAFRAHRALSLGNRETKRGKAGAATCVPCRSSDDTQSQNATKKKQKTHNTT